MLATTDELRQQALAASDLTRHVHQALAHGAIIPFAQTVNDLRTGDVVGVELLARWQQEDGSIRTPDAFIPAIESNGMGAELGRQMIRHAIAALVALTEAGDTSTWVSVNLSAHSLYQRQLPSEVFDAIGGAPFDWSRLVLEITESQQLSEASPVWKATANRLDSLGVSLAIDDFGTGYSSINQLISLPFSYLKVDRALTHAATQGGTADMCAYVASFAHSEGMTPVAEGIETEAERDAMWSCGYEVGQGWLFHKAEPVEQVLDLIAEAAAVAPPPATIRETA